MGTFSTSFNAVDVVGPRGSLFTTGWCSQIDGKSTDADLLQSIRQYTLIDHSSITASLSFNISPFNVSISLDSKPLIEWDDLPNGIIFSNLVFNWGGQMFTIGATSSFRVTCGNYDSGVLNDGPYSFNNLAINPGTSYTPLQILNIIAEVALTSSGNAVISTPTNVLNIDGFGLNGTYTIATPSNSLVNLQTPNPTVNSGDNIIMNVSSGGVLSTIIPGTTPGPYPGSGPTITAGPPILNLLWFNEIFVSYYDSFGVLQFITILSSQYLIWTHNQIVFTMPPIPVSNPPVILITLVGNGTNFTGQVQAGALPTIYFLDGSGIYTLSSTATSDLLYVNGTNQLLPVAIPNPYIKTGFIP